MNTYYYDFGWEGGVVVVAETEEKALELIKKESYHGNYVGKLNLLKPGEVYTFMGDS